MSDRYEIREQIGKGGLGAVYKAFDTQLQREVAMKRVLSMENGTPEEVEDAGRKLIAEAQTLSSLNHPNIVTVFDVGTDKKGGFVVMELLNGETLDETVERGVLTQEDFTEVVYQTQEALIAAQAINVIHRDIKPSNIMVIWQASGKFQTKILDFGLAKFSQNPSVQTMDQDESVMGSIFFMAPEQFERGELDARTDLYQMGCVYYHCLTGQYPFNGETAPQVMNAHLQHRVTPIEQVRPDLSPSICQWIMWLINRDISHRPTDARDALAAWPRNPEPPGANVQTQLPVEASEGGAAMKVITSANQAAAPPKLIVGAPASAAASGAILKTSATGGAPTISAAAGTTGTHSAAVPVQPQPKKRTGLWITLGSLASVVAIFVIINSVKKGNIKKRHDRLEFLASSEKPTGKSEDIEILMDFIGDRNASHANRADAFKVLKTIEGAGLNEKILEVLKSDESSYRRLKAAQALAERDYSPAIGSIITNFRQASKDDDRVTYLNAARVLASLDSVDSMLDALQGDHSLTVRRVFEDTVLTVIRKEKNPSKVIDNILKRVSSTSGSERKSLFRILGVLGTDKVRNRLDSIYGGSQNDISYQRDAMIAFLSWPNRSPLPLVREILNKTKDKALENAALRAFVHLSGVPGTEPIEERVKIWKECFALLSNPNDVRRVIGHVVENPHPSGLAMLKEWSNHKIYAPLAKGAAQTVEKSLNSTIEIAPNEPLKGKMARLHGDGRASLTPFLESLTGWTSPETYFSWKFKLKEAGEYRIEVDQATLRKDPSDFVIYLNGQTLSGQSQQTDTLEEFTPVKVDGSVKLEAGKLYSMQLLAGKVVQPRMMDIGAIRLLKK